ncbi:MAG: efflux RND transporter permease subunit [Desulfobacteraceae bacterium]|nr:efflux RND transporter permease subunit [Desulfobacteraceae bacterium]
MKVTEYAVKRRLAVSAIAAAFVVLGLYGLWRLPVDYLPDVTYPIVKIQIRWAAAAPEEIDTEIADPLERFMATVDRLDHLESSSMEGVYSLDVHFEYGADIDVAFQDVLAALTRAERQLPDDIDAPYVFKADPSYLPVMQITASSKRWDPLRLRDWADNWLQDRIFAVSGVAGTEIIGGLIVALGVVLDNSIIVVENISRLRRRDPETEPSRHAVDATTEVGPALIAATLSFLALFVPFLIVPGLVSLVIAVSITPMITAVLFGSKGMRARAGRFEKIFARLTEVYGRVIARAIKWRWGVAVLFLLALGAGFVLLGRLGGEFLPLIDDGRITVKVKMPTGASVRATDQVVRKIENLVAGDPRIESIFALAGGQIRGLTTYEIANEGQVDIQLVPRAERDISTKAYVNELRKKTGRTEPPGGRVMARQMPIKGIAGLRAADIIVRVRGQDMEILGELASRTAGEMKAIKGLANVSVSMDRTKPEYQVRVDREKAAELGVSVSDVAESLRSLIEGAVPMRFRNGSEYYDIRVLVPEEELSSRADVENLILTGRDNEHLRLKDIAEGVPAMGPVEIMREDQIKQISIEAKTEGSDIAGAA